MPGLGNRETNGQTNSNVANSKSDESGAIRTRKSPRNIIFPEICWFRTPLGFCSAKTSVLPIERGGGSPRHFLLANLQETIPQSLAGMKVNVVKSSEYDVGLHCAELEFSGERSRGM